MATTTTTTEERMARLRGVLSREEYAALEAAQAHMAARPPRSPSARGQRPAPRRDAGTRTRGEGGLAPIGGGTVAAALSAGLRIGDEEGVAAAVAERTYECELCGARVEAQVLTIRQLGRVSVRRRDCQCVVHQRELEAEEARLRAREEQRPACFYRMPLGRSMYWRWADERFDAYDRAMEPDLYDHHLAWADAAVRLWESTAGVPDWRLAERKAALAALPNLTVLGHYGIGKTHLAAAVAHRLIDHGVPVLFARTVDMLDAVRETWHLRDQATYSEEEVVRRFSTAPVLILDDVGYQPKSQAARRVPEGGADLPLNWHQNVLYRIMDARVGVLPTLVNSLNATKLSDAFGEAAYDRLFEHGGLYESPVRESYRQRMVAAVTPSALAQVGRSQKAPARRPRRP